MIEMLCGARSQNNIDVLLEESSPMSPARMMSQIFLKGDEKGCFVGDLDELLAFSRLGSERFSHQDAFAGGDFSLDQAVVVRDRRRDGDCVSGSSINLEASVCPWNGQCRS
jgi:hypothetical protein